MKKASAIFLLILLCVYSFTFKTHYCYHIDTGERFHGDCEADIKEAAAQGGLAHTKFFPKQYICFDFVKNAQIEQTKIFAFKNSLTDEFIFPPTIEILIPQIERVDWLLPEVHCRSGTLILSLSLRGPPLV